MEKSEFNKWNVCVCVCVCVESERERERERERESCVIPEGLEPQSFSLKYNHKSSEYKIHSVEVDLYYFKYL